MERVGGLEGVFRGCVERVNRSEEGGPSMKSVLSFQFIDDPRMMLRGCEKEC